MWQETNNKLTRTFKFNSFDEAMDFVNKTAKVARSLNHHPEIINNYQTVEIRLQTHDQGGKVTDRDRDFAKKIDQLLSGDVEAEKRVDETTVVGAVTSIKLYADGGSRGNPGPSATGFALLDTNGTVLHKSGEYLGITTNNQAEYQALKHGLEEARKIGAREVEVFMDSMLVVNQMKGIFKVKSRDLWPIHESIKVLAKGFKKISFTHVPRELNKLADSAVNEILDAELDKS